MVKKKKSLKTLVKKILICFIILYIGGTLVGQQFDIARLNREIDEVDGQIAEAKREGEILESEMEASKTDEYAERVAREAQERCCKKIIIGLPKNMDGSSGGRTRERWDSRHQADCTSCPPPAASPARRTDSVSDGCARCGG